ncbi:MAG: PilT/PilU family type 4a pilus ATPase [Bermanella sp.]
MTNTTLKHPFENVLQRCIERGASDVHLSLDCPVCYRVSGEMRPDDNSPLIDAGFLQDTVDFLLSPRQLDIFSDTLSIDTGFTAHGGHRFRINLYHERGNIAIAARWLDGTFHSLETLRLPSQIARLAELKDGLVLVTGATGSGKSTTLASLINEINLQRRCHILTIEDPIEFVYSNHQAVVHQREVGRDVPSFAQAIRAAMREDPDVILLGEMRDTETMEAALTAAETGHLVFSTLHTNDAVGVIDRLVGSFPGNEQSGVRQQLSSVLRAVVTQILVKVEGGGRVPVNEILIVNGGVSNLIRNHKPEQIRSMMETGRMYGNQTLEYALALRIKEKLISKEQAMGLTHRPTALEQVLRAMQQDRTLEGSF